jgi:hypothetical protein
LQVACFANKINSASQLDAAPNLLYHDFIHIKAGLAFLIILYFYIFNKRVERGASFDPG